MMALYRIFREKATFAAQKNWHVPPQRPGLAVFMKVGHGSTPFGGATRLLACWFVSAHMGC